MPNEPRTYTRREVVTGGATGILGFILIEAFRIWQDERRRAQESLNEGKIQQGWQTLLEHYAELCRGD